MEMSIEVPPGGLVIGIGTDIIEVDRIKRAHERHGDRFLGRIYTDEEREYCFSMNNPYPHLAARFAAKEAVSKAFTTGIGRFLKWTSISIHKGQREQPLVRMDATGRDLMGKINASLVLITLSHTRNYANAVALLLRDSTRREPETR
jgi:holo-[acyl-carrier protein] synthase